MKETETPSTEAGTPEAGSSDVERQGYVDTPKPQPDAPGWYFRPSPNVKIWMCPPLYGGIEDADFEVVDECDEST